MSENGNEPAFGHGDHAHGGAAGLTKRELIAAMSFAVRCHGSMPEYEDPAWPDEAGARLRQETREAHARAAVKDADALLAALAQASDGGRG